MRHLASVRINSDDLIDWVNFRVFNILKNVICLLNMREMLKVTVLNMHSAQYVGVIINIKVSEAK